MTGTDSTTRPPKRWEFTDQRYRLSTDSFGVAVVRNVVVVYRRDRPELPHATITFRVEKNELDVHLTHNLPNGGKEYVSGPRIQLERLGEMIRRWQELYTTGIWSQVEPVTPEELERQSYLVLLPEPEHVQDWLQRHVERHRGARSWMVDMEALERGEHALQLLERTAWAPEALDHVLADPSFDQPVRAVSLEPGIPTLCLFPIRDEDGDRWVAYRTDRLRGKPLMEGMRDIYLEALDGHREPLFAIVEFLHEGLHLDDVGLHMDELRKLFSRP